MTVVVLARMKAYLTNALDPRPFVAPHLATGLPELANDVADEERDCSRERVRVAEVGDVAPR